MPLISVIMPSYNVKNYIAECIESVCNQTLYDIEILSIDAGSEDGTLEILRDYEGKDSRIKVILSEQKSYGYQVNKGIDMAQGEYIAIVETDDVAESNMLEVLYKEAKNHDLDYVKGQFTRWIAFKDGIAWKQKMRTYPLCAEEERKVIIPSLNPMTYIRDIFLWSGIYKRDFLIQNNIRLNETKGAAYQDVGFAFQVIGCAERAMYIPDVVYNYRQNNAGSSIFNTKGFHYLEQEYPFVKEKAMRKYITEDSFLACYYVRMFLQVMTRYRTMAASGSLWEGTEAERLALREKIEIAYANGYLDEYLLGKAYWQELQQYLVGEEAYWQYQLNLYDAKRRGLCELLDKAKRADSIVFYSKSVVGGFVYSLFKTANINIPISFCDNSKEKQGTFYMNAPVISVEEAVSNNPNALYIIANRRFDQSMRKQLVDLGIDRSQIYVWMLDMDILLLHMEV